MGKMIRIKFGYPVLLLMIIGFLALSCHRRPDKTVIALSYVYGDTATNSYIKWLKNVDPEAGFVVMYDLSPDSVDMVFRDCSGLLLTGGADVYPGVYGKEHDTARCGSFDRRRDSLEFKLIKMAFDRKMPVLGVCRGEQILNVAGGGTLYVDIPTDVNTMIRHRCKDWKNCYHMVKVLPDNLLSEISGVKEGKVTSNHHQAIDRLAKDYRVMAIANDGLIEAIGWRDTTDKSFLLAVQWHPERMDTASRLSTPIAKRFMEEAERYRLK